MIFVVLQTCSIFLVMTIYCRSYVWHGRAEFYCAFTANVHKFVIWWKVFFEWLAEYSSNIVFIGLHAGLNQMLRFLFILILFWLLILNLSFMSTLFQALFFIVNDWLLKYIFWWWYSWKSFFDRLLNVLDYFVVYEN